MRISQLKWTPALLALAATNALAATSQPKAPTLKVGDPAPRFQCGRWFQGEPVKGFQKDKACLVEFWATWCGPCRVSIPHLNEIHEKYKDKGLIVIGQDCWERDEKLVEPFIKQMGDKMTYRVALDDKTGSERGAMAETWMAAAGRSGIPSAFLVDTKGLIAWIGHPMQLKETVIEAVLNGAFDIKKAAEDYVKQQKKETAMRSASQALSKAMANKDWDEAESRLSEAEKLLPDDERDGLSMTRFTLAVGKGDYKAAYGYAEKASDANQDNASLQNTLAWQILTDQKIKERDLKLAEKIATRANDAAKGKEPAILDTLARAYFMNGKKEEAILLQEKAVKLAEGNLKNSAQETLDSYKQGRLPDAEQPRPSTLRPIVPKQPYTNVNEGRLYRINLDGSGQALFLDPRIVGKHTVSKSVFSPIGTKLLWAAQGGNWSPTMELYIADYIVGAIATNTIIRLTTNAQHDNWMAFSPDASKIIFSRGANGSGYEPPSDLFIMNSDGSGRETQIDGAMYTAYGSAWAPAGKILLNGQPTPGSASNNVYVILPNGAGLTQLTAGNYWEGHAQWLPEVPGNLRIVFTSNSGGNHDIWKMKEDGTELQQLTTNPADETSPFVSPDFTKIAYVRAAGTGRQIRMMNADGSGDTLVATFPATSGTSNELYEFNGWLPDGSGLLVCLRP